MKFTWDENKDAKNYQDHGIHLSTGALVFNDPYRIERPDVSANNYTLENRWQTIGKVNDLLFVAYEERTNDEIRLISVRLANAKERKLYYGNQTNDNEPWSSAY